MSNAFPVTGFMLDISRDRVPTRETLEFLVDLLHRCGYDQLELYVEHTFAHAGHEAVWRDASPLTADDMRWLDGMCRAHGISLVPNRNCLGHMDRWLKCPEYRGRAESADGYDAWGKHWPPHMVAMTADNFELVTSLLDELVDTTTARAVNIGMDEPLEIGLGASRERVEQEGRGKVYTDWVLAVAQPWLERGYRVEMWGDILADHPEQSVRLPKGIALVMWCYDSPEVIRRDSARGGWGFTEPAGFGGLLAPFTGRGRSLWVAPGTGVWHSVTGRLDCAVGNILDAATVGSGVGCGGFLLTSWGDSGHWEGYVHCLVPIIVGGLAAADPARAGELTDPAVLQRVVGERLFGDARHRGAELLVRTGLLHSLLDHPVGNSTVLFHELFDFYEVPQLPMERIDAARGEADDLKRLCDELPTAGWVEEVRTSLDLALVALDRLAGKDTPVPAELVARVRRNWLASSRPGGLADSLARASNVEPVPQTDLPPVGSDHFSGLLGRP